MRRSPPWWVALDARTASNTASASKVPSTRASVVRHSWYASPSWMAAWQARTWAR